MSSRSSASTGLFVAAAGAAGVLASLWLPWYLIRLPQSFRDALSSLGAHAQQGVAPASPGAALGNALGGMMQGLAAALPTEITGNGWEVMHGGDVALAIIAGAALLVALAVGGGLTGVNIELGAAGRFVAALGSAAVAIAVYHVISRPGMGMAGSALSADVSVKYGIWVAILGGVAMIAGGLMVGRTTSSVTATAFAPPVPPMGTGTGPQMPWDTATSAPPPGV